MGKWERHWVLLSHPGGTDVGVDVVSVVVGIVSRFGGFRIRSMMPTILRRSPLSSVDGGRSRLKYLVEEKKGPTTHQ